MPCPRACNTSLARIASRYEVSTIPFDFLLRPTLRQQRCFSQNIGNAQAISEAQSDLAQILPDAVGGDQLDAVFQQRPRGKTRQQYALHESFRKPPIERPENTAATPAQGFDELYERRRFDDGNVPRSRQDSKPRQRRDPLIFEKLASMHLAGVRKLTPKSWIRVKEDLATHKQWGYLRHQVPEAELPTVKRAFKYWKNKRRKMLDPELPAIWPWREKGKWLYELRGVEEMRTKWTLLDTETRSRDWPLLMLSTMCSCPEKASAVLEATLDPLPPGYAIYDVLLFIAQRLNLEDGRTASRRVAQCDAVLRLLAAIFEHAPANHVPFGQRLFGLFAHKLLPDHVADLYNMASNMGVTMHKNTKLHFAGKLAEDAAHKSLAFDITKELVSEGTDLSEARFASVITSLLHCREEKGGLEGSGKAFSPKDALQFFVEKGLAPNPAHSTALLESLCQKDEVEEAIRLALLFAECGMPMDERLWRTVFRGAKKSLDVGNVLKALDVARAANAPYVDVLSNALHSVFCFAAMGCREKQRHRPWVLRLFGPLLRIYAKKFDLDALQPWFPDPLAVMAAQDATDFEASSHERRWNFQHSILPVVEELFFDGDDRALPPSEDTLAIMIRAYIRTLPQRHDVVTYYQFFASRLKQHADETGQLSPLIKSQGTLIHDTFLLAMTEHRGLVCQALRLFGDMLHDNTTPDETEASERSENDQPPRGIVHPAPTVLTFTILLRGLFSHSQPDLAKELLALMREQGIQPNLVTWNTLTKGYASLQRIEKVIATMQSMEATGLKPDMHTLRAFSKLRNQALALRRMEEIIERNRQRLGGGEPQHG